MSTFEGFLRGIYKGIVVLGVFFVFSQIVYAATPSEPLYVSAFSTHGSFVLVWAQPVSDGGNEILDYHIEYKDHLNSVWSVFDDGVSADLGAVLHGFADDTVYDFRVRAVTIDGQGTASATVSELFTITPYLLILSTGQSLALGTDAGPEISTTQPYNNFSLSSPDGPSGYTGPLIPLIERGVETPSSGMANALHVYDVDMSRPIGVALHAADGMNYDNLKQGTQPYEYGLMQAVRIRDEVDAIGSDTAVIPVGVTVVHGETDYVDGTAHLYEEYLTEWQEDYAEDINSIVGAQYDIPLYISQMNTAWTGEIADAQYEAHKNNPDTIILIGPQYQYEYAWDNLHLTNVSSKHLGELFAKVMKNVFLDEKEWNPLMPDSIERSNNIITVDYHIPEAPLVFDTTTVAQRPDYGFDFVQTGGNSVTIDEVRLIDNDTKVEILLSDTPTGTDQRLRYAWGCSFVHTGYGRCGNKDDGDYVGGNLRDSDSSTSPSIDSTGLPLYNWGVAFEEPVIEQLETSSGGSENISSNSGHASQMNRRVLAYLMKIRKEKLTSGIVS